MAKAAVRSKAVVLLLLTCCLLLLQLWESVVVLCFVYVTLCPFWFCSHLDGEESAGCFAWFVFLVSRDCCVTFPRGFMGFMGFSAVCDFGIF